MYRLVKRNGSWLLCILSMCVRHVAAMRCSSDIPTQVAAVCLQLYRLKDQDIMKEGVKDEDTKDIVSRWISPGFATDALRIKFNWTWHLNPKSYGNALLLATENSFSWLQSNERIYVSWGHAVETTVNFLPVIFLSYFLILRQWTKWMISKPAKNWFHPPSQ